LPLGGVVEPMTTVPRVEDIKDASSSIT
jgi:hypothetical protein